MITVSPRGRRRSLHLLAFTAVTALGGIVVALLLPGGRPVRSSISIALADASLLAIFLTLAIGPLNVLRRRPNPRSTDLRRDLGLWAAATGAIHIVLALGNHFGGEIGRYFFLPPTISLRSVRHDAFGLGVWSGAAATVVLALLAAISNDRSIRWLGPRWKRLQRTNYALVLLAVAHTVLFWYALRRGPALWAPTLLAALVLLTLQVFGVRRVRRQAGSG